jgi:hypothetical protein
MSLLNQPSRIFISADDLEWGTGQNFNMTLEEAVTGAVGVECSRAAIPNTQYPIPAYQSKFYYSINGVNDFVQLTYNRNFTSMTDLIAQLNADALAQSKPVTFAYDTDTTRVSVTIGGAAYATITVDNTNNNITLYDDTSSTYADIVVPAGTYTFAAWNTAVSAAIAAAVAQAYTLTSEPVWNSLVITSNSTLSGGFVVGDYRCTSKVAGAVVGFSMSPLVGTDAARRQASAPNFGFVWGSATINFGIPDTDPIQSPPGATAVIVGAVIPAFSSGGVGQPVAVSPRSAYDLAPGSTNALKNRFGLNTRLGFPYVGISGLTGGATYTGTFLPNLIRTRVIYVLTNFAVNDSLSTDGLRTCIAKIPVNSSYGGITIYAPAELNFSRIIQQTLQNIQVSLLDDNYQPYMLNVEEPTELEIFFKYVE